MAFNTTSYKKITLNEVTLNIFPPKLINRHNCGWLYSQITFLIATLLPRLSVGVCWRVAFLPFQANELRRLLSSSAQAHQPPTNEAIAEVEELLGVGQRKRFFHKRAKWVFVIDNHFSTFLRSPNFFRTASSVFFSPTCFRDLDTYNELHDIFSDSSEKIIWAVRSKNKSSTCRRKGHEQQGPKTHLRIRLGVRELYNYSQLLVQIS